MVGIQVRCVIWHHGMSAILCDQTSSISRWWCMIFTKI